MNSFSRDIFKRRKRRLLKELGLFVIIAEIIMLVSQLRPTLCVPMVCPWESPGKNTGMVAVPFSRGSFQLWD